jgi:CRISPR/Cas system CSM-associated protein Csm3 (group 7 of RAMP superfamily)
MSCSFRYIARITVEAETPLTVGSGDSGLMIDKLVAKDANFLPYIPGTSLAGVLRHSLDKSLADEIFGSGGEDGEGSKLIISAAMLIGEDGKEVIEGLKKLDYSKGYYSYFSRLPERDHVRMNDKGAADAKNHGKYDEELVHKGVRFVFELEYISHKKEDENWDRLLNTLAHPNFRIGGGTRKGFGKLKIIAEKSHQRCFNLSLQADFEDYLNHTGSLNYKTEGWNDLTIASKQKADGWQLYKLTLQAKDYFIFGAGFGDKDADNIPKTEQYFTWDSGKPVLIEQEKLLIPATSIKGILSHRVAYHYNLLTKNYIGSKPASYAYEEFNAKEAVEKYFDKYKFETMDNDPDDEIWEQLQKEIEAINIDDIPSFIQFKRNINEAIQDDVKNGVGENNKAVKALFGYSKNTEYGQDGQRGKVVLNDLYLPYNKENAKVFNHVKIDRFTGGASDGALFQEKAVRHDTTITLEIWVDTLAFKEDENIQKAWEAALYDITSGRLPIGGHSSKGHGIFTGSLEKK